MLQEPVTICCGDNGSGGAAQRQPKALRDAARRNAHLSPAAQALYDMILKQAGSVRGENG